MAVPTTRQALAEHLSDQARWRGDKAEEYPEDKRNLEWSDRLERLSVLVGALRDDDESLLEIDRTWGRYGLDVFSTPGERTAQLTNRPDTDNFDVWLSTFTEAFTEESIELAADTDDEFELVEFAQDHDPAVALQAIRSLSYALEAWEEEAVLRARVEGYPWSRIASLLGKGRQTVWKKYRDPDKVEFAD